MQKHIFPLSFLLLLMVLFTNCTPKDGASKEAVVKGESLTATALPTKSTADTLIQKKIPEPISKNTIKEAEFSIDYLMGKFEPEKNANFTKIDKQYASRENMYLRKDAYQAFIKMYDAAKKDGVNFKILSATRPFLAQKSIWEAKWTGQRLIENGKDASKSYPNPKDRALKILEYSSMPGTSRHHWGTDIDINSLENAYFEKGNGLKEYDWLLKNAATYGFCQPYTKKDAQRPHGYHEEKWHWSYLPVAKQLTDQAKKMLKNEMITGFKGAEIATQIEVVENYVLGINDSCL